MTNLRTDEMVFYRNLTKIGTDENKAIYSSSFNPNSDQNIQSMVKRMCLSWHSTLFRPKLVKIVLYCKFIFSVHIFSTLRLAVPSYRPFSFRLYFFRHCRDFLLPSFAGELKAWLAKTQFEMQLPWGRGLNGIAIMKKYKKK